MLNRYRQYLLIILVSLSHISKAIEVNDIITLPPLSVNQDSSNALAVNTNSDFIDLGQNKLPSIKQVLESDFEPNVASNSSENTAVSNEIAPAGDAISNEQNDNQNKEQVPLPVSITLPQKINLVTTRNITPIQVSNTEKLISKAVSKSVALAGATSSQTIIPIQNLPKLPSVVSVPLPSKKDGTSLLSEASKTIDKLLADPTSDEYKAKKAAAKAKLINEQRRRIFIASNIIKRYHKKNNIIINGYTSDIALIKAHDALTNNNISSLRIMLDNYPILNRKDHRGDDLLQIAIKTGNYQLTRYLLIKGANIFAKDFENESILAIASDNDDQNIVKLLCRAGAR